jgi:hypothetical protein
VKQTRTRTLFVDGQSSGKGPLDGLLGGELKKLSNAMGRVCRSLSKVARSSGMSWGAVDLAPNARLYSASAAVCN